MLPLKRFLVSAVVAALLTLGVHYAIRANHLKEASRLRAQNDRMRFEISQRREVQVAKETDSPRPESLTQAAPIRHESADENKAGASSALIGARQEPPGDYRREGRDTPVATLQSIAWACDHGDLAAMQQLIVFDAPARTKAGVHLAALPAKVRAQWASPEAMAAALLISDGINHPFPIAAILEQATTELLSVERVVLHLPDTAREHTEYQRTAEGWKFAITETMVDDYLERAAPASAQP